MSVHAFICPCWLSCFLKPKSRLHSCFFSPPWHCVRDVESYVNFSLSLSICLSLCQVVGADAVTTVWSWQALVDAVKCSSGINTSEGRNEKWGVKKMRWGEEKKKNNSWKIRTQQRNTIWASQRSGRGRMDNLGLRKQWWVERKDESWESTVACIQCCWIGLIQRPLNTQSDHGG